MNLFIISPVCMAIWLSFCWLSVTTLYSMDGMLFGSMDVSTHASPSWGAVHYVASPYVQREVEHTTVRDVALELIVAMSSCLPFHPETKLRAEVQHHLEAYTSNMRKAGELACDLVMRAWDRRGDEMGVAVLPFFGYVLRTPQKVPCGMLLLCYAVRICAIDLSTLELQVTFFTIEKDLTGIIACEECGIAVDFRHVLQANAEAQLPLSDELVIVDGFQGLSEVKVGRFISRIDAEIFDRVATRRREAHLVAPETRVRPVDR